MAKKTKTALKYPRRAEFTIADIIAINDNLNAQTVRTHVRSAIRLAALEVVGYRRSGDRGRPSFVLARVLTS